MTPDETAELHKLAQELRRGMLQLQRAYDLLAKYIEICYTDKEYLEIDETASVANAAE